MENDRRLLGENIRKQRELLFITQEELAERAGKDAAYIGRVERGTVNVTIDNLQQIARGLEVGLDFLFQKDRPDLLKNYIPEVELGALDPPRRHRALVLLKILNMVVDLAEPDDVYQTALLDNLFRSFPVTSYTLTASRRLIDRRRMRLYGIQATQIFPDGSVLRRTFPELSDNRRIVENLVKRLNNGLVSFDHFEEILEDFIAGDYRLSSRTPRG